MIPLGIAIVAMIGMLVSDRRAWPAVVVLTAVLAIGVWQRNRNSREVAQFVAHALTDAGGDPAKVSPGLQATFDQYGVTKEWERLREQGTHAD